MAKKSKTRKPTALKLSYRKEVARIKRFMRRAEQRGYMFDFEIPKEPARVTKQSVSKLKNLTATELYKKAQFVDTQTGEIISGTEGRKLERSRSARKGQETKKRKKQAEQQFWTGQAPAGATTQTSIPTPVATGEDLFGNILDEIVSKLEQSPSEEYTNMYSGKKQKRRSDLIELERRTKSRLLDLIDQAVSKMGKSALGWYLQDHMNDIDLFLDAIMYASSSEQVNFGFTGISRLINQAVNLDPGEYQRINREIDDELELLEGWDELL